VITSGARWEQIPTPSQAIESILSRGELSGVMRRLMSAWFRHRDHRGSATVKASVPNDVRLYVRLKDPKSGRDQAYRAIGMATASSAKDLGGKALQTFEI
jgi:hypothetical protein